MMGKMQNAMMANYKLFAWMGIMIVLLAFVFSLVGSGAQSDFFSVDKATREGAGAAVISANISRHVIPAWVPSFKFLGLGILLGTITMALGVIATTLRNLGTGVMSKWPADLNPGTPEKPRSAKMFPILMMMGWMILMAGFVWAIVFGYGTVAGYWDNSISQVLNPAAAGSSLLDQLGAINAVLPWLGAVRFMGMAVLFSAISVALTVIIRTLQHQEKSLRRFVELRS